MKKVITLLVIFSALHSITLSQITTGGWLAGGEAFMKGRVIEVGVSAWGGFGTCAAPPFIGGAPGDAWHPNATYPGLGFVADHQKDDWSVGTPGYCGDYFVPGSPVEGWGLKFNGLYYLNTDGPNCFGGSIPGSITSVVNTVDSVRVVWQGSISGVNITQTTRFHKDSLFFVTDVVICNNSGATINDVYYGRNVDPDNEQPWSFDFTTNNTNIWQAIAPSTTSYVEAEGLLYGCYLGLGTKDARSRVCHGGFSTDDPQYYYDGSFGHIQTIGTTTMADEAISLGLSLGDIPNNACECFAFAYVLSEAQIGSALNATTGVGVTAGGVDISSSLTAPICPPATSVDLTLTGGSAYTWTWSPAAGLSATSGTAVTASPSTTTTYTASGIKPGICGQITKTITVVVDNSTLDAGPNQTVCMPTTVNLNSTYSGFPLTGITCTPNYIVSAIPHAPQAYPGAASTTLISSPGYDEFLYGPFVLPFTFNFFCDNYTNFYVSSNGFVTFDPMAGTGCCSGQSIPQIWQPNNVIAGAWEDLNPSASGPGYIRWWVSGTAPNRVANIRFNNIHHFVNGNRVYFQIQMHETSNNIEIHLQDMPTDGGLHTCGIENATGTVGFWPPGKNSASWSAVNEGYRFVPAPIITGGYSWSPPGLVSDPTLADPTASPTTTTWFYLTADNGYCVLEDSVLITNNCVLPAEMLELSGIKSGNTSELYWTLASEVNVDYFEVERSSNGVDYASIGTVNSQGNSSGPRHYDFTDFTPAAGTNWYRLRVVDNDGNVEFSNLVELAFGNGELNNLLSVSPNPSKGEFIFQLHLAAPEEIMLKVYDHQGKEVLNQEISGSARGALPHRVDLGSQPSGVYFYDLKIGHRVFNGKLTVLR